MEIPADEFHVTIDFQSETPDLSLPYSLIGLETDHPILRIDREIYVGTWAETVGTEMIFDEKGEWLLNVEKRLMMERADVTKKGEAQPKTARELIVRLEDLPARSQSEGQHESGTVTMEAHTGEIDDSVIEPMLIDDQASGA